MRHRWLRVACTLAVIAAIAIGCASRGGSRDSSASGTAKREADDFKAQARQGLADFQRAKPQPPACEIGYLTGRDLTVLATSEWIERAGLRRGDRIVSIEGIPASQLGGQARPPARIPPGTPFNVTVARGGRELTLKLVCIVRPEVWMSARRTQEAAAMGDWEACQAAALDYIFSVGFMESLALEFHGRCGFHKAMMRGDRFNLDLARDLYDWQVFRIREKSYEPGGLDEIRESVLGTVAILRREGFREYADNLESELRQAPARVAAEIGAAPASSPATPRAEGQIQRPPTAPALTTPEAPVTAQAQTQRPPTAPTLPPADAPVAAPPPSAPVVPPPAAPPATPPPPPPAPPPPATPPPTATQPPPAPSPPATPPPAPPPQVQRPPTPAPPSSGPPRTSQATGFLVRPDGLLLTALHVVDGARSVAITCPGREPVPATLAGGARDRDLATLKTSLTSAAYLSLRDARALLPGDPVFTMGYLNATASDPAPRFSDGSLHAVTGPGTETGFLQMTMALEPGNEGGPVVAADGSAVGVVSSGGAIILLLREPGIFPQGVSWAIKSDLAIPLFQQPPTLPVTRTRSEAIERAGRATCRIVVTR